MKPLAWFPLPFLLLAAAAPDFVLDLPALLLGARLGLDGAGRLFLGFSALLWLLAAHYAAGYLREDPARGRFMGLFCLTGLGNLLLPLTLDAASFYLAFAVMTFAAYGLVVHTASHEALRAGRIYLIMALLGEMLLLTALWRLAQTAPSLLVADLAAAARLDPAACALLAAGFGVKTGLPLLHMWLPLAHPVAPTPASAVLSGAIIKAGVLGWLRFLPLGAAALPDLGWTLTGLGLAAAFLGVAIGLAQSAAKTVLAYSSVSQMGLISVGVGVGLAHPELWPALAPAVGVQVVHHGLAKGALFLGVGLPAGRWTLAGLALPALALAGAPLTSGALAKSALKAPLPEYLGLMLAVAAGASTLLMLRLLWLLRARPRAERADARMTLSWAGALIAVAGAPVWLSPLLPELPPPAPWSAAWPVLAGLAVAAALFRYPAPIPGIPPGDVLAWLEPGLTRLWRALLRGVSWPDRLAAGGKADGTPRPGP